MLRLGVFCGIRDHNVLATLSAEAMVVQSSTYIADDIIANFRLGQIYGVNID